MFAKSVVQISCSKGYLYKFNQTLPFVILSWSWDLLLHGSQGPQPNYGFFLRNRDEKLFIRNLNVRILMLLRGKTGKNSISGGFICRWEVGLLETQNHLKKPPSSPFCTQSTILSKGCLLSNLVPISWYVFNYLCACMCMYMCQPNILSKMKIPLCCYQCFMIGKGAFYARQS